MGFPPYREYIFPDFPKRDIEDRKEDGSFIVYVLSVTIGDRSFEKGEVN